MGMKLLFVLLAGTGLFQISYALYIATTTTSTTTPATTTTSTTTPGYVDDSAAPLSCYSCQGVSDWRECLTRNETCRSKPIYSCESRKQRNTGLYYAGCKPAKSCKRHAQLQCPNQQSNGVSGNGDNGGGSNASNVNMCFKKCCSTDFCNNQPPDITTTTSTTTPATTTTSTTTPATTTTSTTTPATTTTPTTTPATSACTSDYTYESSLELCYKLYQQYGNFSTAQSICAGDGGRVIHITSSVMNEFLAAAIEDWRDDTMFWNWWIDGHYLGSWVHSDGTPLIYTNFPYDPYMDDYKHIIMSLSFDDGHGWWRVENNYQSWGIICEKGY